MRIHESMDNECFRCNGRLNANTKLIFSIVKSSLIPINEMIFILLDHRNPYLATKTIEIGQEIKILWPNYVFGVMAAFFGSRMQ